jgi:hypothetical protein
MITSSWSIRWDFWFATFGNEVMPYLWSHIGHCILMFGDYLTLGECSCFATKKIVQLSSNDWCVLINKTRLCSPIISIHSIYQLCRDKVWFFFFSFVPHLPNLYIHFTPISFSFAIICVHSIGWMNCFKRSISPPYDGNCDEGEATFRCKCNNK